MTTASLLLHCRLAAGLTQTELARRAHTSRPTVSAYEHGSKSPTLATAARLLDATGHQLTTAPRIHFRTHLTRRGRPFVVPDALWRLPVHAALAVVDLPLHLSWSGGERVIDLADRPQRARCYEVVLSEGTGEDIERIVDGALLVDLWDELVLPRDIRSAWEPVVGVARAR